MHEIESFICNNAAHDVILCDLAGLLNSLGHLHGGNTIGTTCVVDRDDTAYMVVDREFRLPTE